MGYKLSETIDSLSFPAFAKLGLKIITMEGKLVFLDLNKPQLLVHSVLEAQRQAGLPMRAIVLKARREGISTYVSGKFFRDINRRPMRYACTCSADAEATDKVFKMVRLFQDEIPIDIKRQTDYSSRKEIIYSPPHRSQFLCQTAGTDVLGRGGLTHYLHATEFAFWNKAKEQFGGAAQEIPDDPETCIVIESTANGMGGPFYDMFVSAIERYKRTKSLDGYMPIFLPWFIFDKYQKKLPKGWTATAEELELKKEYNLSLEQLCWRRWAIENKCQNDIRLFKQEYPACVTGDTKVSNNGIYKIEDIVPHGKIKKKYDNGKNNVYLLTTELGYSVEATKEHKIKTSENGFVRVGDISIGDEILLKEPDFAKNNVILNICILPTIIAKLIINKEIGRLLGYFMGDGSFYSNQLSFACNNDKDVQKDIIDLCEKILGKKPSIRETGKKTGNSFELRLNDKEYIRFFSSIGCIEQKKDSHWKRKVCVPDCIWQSPKDVVKEFLKGLFESDGFNAYGTPKVSLFSKYEEFLRDIQLLLLGFGITSRLAIENKKAGTGRIYTGRVLQLRCNEAIEFNKKIGFISKRKQEKCTRKTAKSIILQDKVKSIIHQGIKHVYDITVEPTNEYSANGILVHNSWLEAFQMSGSPVFTSQIIEYQKRFIRDDIQYGLFDHRDGSFIPNAGGNYGWQVLDGPGGEDHVIGIDTREHKLSDDKDPKSDRDFDGAVVLSRKSGQKLVKAILHGKMGQKELGLQILGAAKHYNNAWVVPEIPMGMMVVQVLSDAGYQNIYHRRNKEFQYVSEDTDDLGYRTTNITRHYLINDMISVLRSNAVICQFSEIIAQMMTFIYDKTGKPIHMPAKHDDLMFGLSLAIQGDLYCPKNISDEIPVYTGVDGDPRKPARTINDLAFMGAIDNFNEEDEEESWGFTE